MQVGTTEHFVRIEDLPQIESTTPFRDVYKRLDQSGCSGFILLEKGQAQAYVKGYELANFVLTGPGKGPKKLRELSGSAIGHILTLAAGRQLAVPVPSQPVEATEKAQPLQIQPDSVFHVSEAGRHVGWFLNHETVLATATGKTVFVCENGHDNPDPDNGSCYRCPGDIVTARRS